MKQMIYSHHLIHPEMNNCVYKGDLTITHTVSDSAATLPILMLDENILKSCNNFPIR
jgi:hypothetical protein